MATISQRQEQFRQGRLANGYRRECFWLEPSAQDALARLRSIYPKKTTRDLIVNQALKDLLAHNTKPLETNQTLLETNSTVLATNSMEPLATNSTPPADRAELATIARSWRGQGVSLEQVATRLNVSGWTPDAIPSEAGAKPRNNAASLWNVKTISQLLNRDRQKT